MNYLLVALIIEYSIINACRSITFGRKEGKERNTADYKWPSGKYLINVINN